MKFPQAIFIFIFLIALNFLCLAAEKDTSLRDGDFVPDFNLSDASGHFHRLSHFRGQKVMVHFWATWCPPCVEEMLLIEYLNQKLKTLPFTIISISSDNTWDDVNNFFSKWNQKPSFLVLLDFSKKIAHQFGTEKFPETYLVDENGQLIKKFEGSHHWLAEEPFKEIEEWISEKHQ